MNDQMDVKHHFIHLSRHCRALACVSSLSIAFFVASHLYSTLSPPHQSKKMMTRQMDDWTNGRMDDETDGWNDASQRPLLYVIIFAPRLHSEGMLLVPVENGDKWWNFMQPMRRVQGLFFWVRGGWGGWVGIFWLFLIPNVFTSIDNCGKWLESFIQVATRILQIITIVGAYRGTQLH